jgi:hypothetical protein
MLQRSEQFLFALTSAAVLLILSPVANSQDAPVQQGQVRGVAVSGAVLTENSCEVSSTTIGKKPELREVPGMHVLDKTEADPLVLTSTTDVKISSVMCWRSEARLAPNDYLVPHKTGFPFYIKTDTGNEATDRAIVLEKIGGSFRVRLLSGPAWSPAEEDEMVRALTLFNKRVAGSPAKSLEGTREE